MYFRAYARRSSSVCDGHVVDVTHVVLETRHAPPETDRVCEVRWPIEAERRAHGALRLRRLELLRRDVARVGETLDFLLQRGDRFLESSGVVCPLIVIGPT